MDSEERGARPLPHPWESGRAPSLVDALAVGSVAYDGDPSNSNVGRGCSLAWEQRRTAPCTGEEVKQGASLATYSSLLR